ncbi:MAG: helix-turn-helix domain-containing GNAT family N-acetyltransferase [Xanthobacteraceae bacterium]
MAASSRSEFAARIDTVRHFNRFYTRKIGVLEERLLQGPFSLAEARVLYELAHRKRPTATDVGRELGLDAGYLSRILKRFERKRLIKRTISRTDARQSLLQVTAKGRKALAPLELKSRGVVGAILKPLSSADRVRLLGNMRSIESILAGAHAEEGALTLRTHWYGDMSWVVARQIENYAQEYGWGERFETLMVRIAAGILENFDPARERIWIAEQDGERVGSVCVVAESKSVARLRLLLVEPEARGLGLGRKLVGECIEFARAVGYRKMMLWTQSNLHSARRIYQKAGFRLVKRKRHRDFGVALVGETWEMDL